jgi:excinuclease ABC subunit C
MKHRGARKFKGDYYGPFASAGSVNTTINALQKLFLLRSCTDSFFARRERPCLLYQIKRCSAPCVGRIDEAGYAELIREAKDFLGGKSGAVQKKIERQMAAAAEALDFESAAMLRDRLRAATFIQGTQAINAEGVGNADVFALAAKGGQVGIQAFFVRGGQNWGHRAFFPATRRTSPTTRCSRGCWRSSTRKCRPRGRSWSTARCPSASCSSRRLANWPATGSRSACRSAADRRRLMEQASRNAAEALDRRLAETGPRHGPGAS